MLWDKFVTEKDAAVFKAAGYGKSIGYGKRPALLVIDVQYSFIGDQPEEEWVQKFSTYNIKYIQAFVQRNGTNPLRDLKTLKSLKRILRAEHPDKIFTYQAKTVIYGTIAANSLGITEVYPLIAGTGSVFLASSLKGKLVKQILCTEYRYALRKCPAVFFQNNDDVSVFRENHILKKQRIQLLHGSGVNLTVFNHSRFSEQMPVCI